MNLKVLVLLKVSSSKCSQMVLVFSNTGLKNRQGGIGFEGFIHDQVKS